MERIFETRGTPRAAPSRDRSLSALSERSPPDRNYQRIRTSFLLCLKEELHFPHRRRYGRKRGTLLPAPCRFISPYAALTLARNPFATLNLHYFNVALCSTLPFPPIGSTRALNFQFRLLFFVALSRST